MRIRKRSTLRLFPWVIIALFISFSAFSSEKIYTYLGPGDVHGYTRALLVLALDKSETEFGSYTLRFAPNMTEARALKSMQERAYPRPIRRFETRSWTLADKSIKAVPFPVYLGVYGYRVCFTSQNNKARLADAKDIRDIRKLNHGLVKGWRDVEILRHNKFIVRESSNLQSLYKQLAISRIDLLCRAAVELPEETALIKRTKNIVLDSTKAFFYTFPFFFYTRADDVEASRRIEFGLLKAYRDGSLYELWSRYHHQALVDAQMDKRQTFTLENPIADNIQFPYQQYLYRPGKPEP